MNRVVRGFVIAVLLSACTSQNLKDHFELSGNIKGVKEGMIYLYYTSSAGTQGKDSASVRDGRFEIQGKIKEPTMGYLMLKENRRDGSNSTSFFLEPARMKVSLVLNEFAKAVVTGSKTQDEMAELNRLKETVMEEMKSVQKEYEEINAKYIAARKEKSDEATLESLKNQADAVHEKFTPFNERLARIDYQFFREHPRSPVTAQMLLYHVSQLPVDTLQFYFDQLGANLQESGLGKDMKKQIDQLRGGSPGSPAKDFVTPDIKGDTLRLSTLRGKYVLLDFWASWCGPCRKGNPHLKELYAKYHDQGIEFIGVSDDDTKPEAWHKAVAKDELPWRHVLRGYNQEKRMKNETNDSDISEKYGIHTLPTKILIDPAGIIIGRYSEEEGPLDKKLEEIFGQAGVSTR